MTTVTFDRLHEAAIERNAMTGDFTCKLCGSVWGSNAGAEFHRPTCLLAESSVMRELERVRLRLAGIEDRLTKIEKRVADDGKLGV